MENKVLTVYTTSIESGCVILIFGDIITVLSRAKYLGKLTFDEAVVIVCHIILEGARV
jgi:hypothetical protein